MNVAANPGWLQRVRRWLPLTLLDGYLVRQFLLHFAFMLLLFTVILVVVDLSEKVGKIIEAKLSFEQVVMGYYRHYVPWFLIKLAPLTVFLSVIVFTGRLSQNSEIVAMLSSGTSFYRLLMPYLVTAGLLSSLTYVVAAYVVPPATREFIAFDTQYFKGRKPAQPRNLHRKIDQRGPTASYLYIRSYNSYQQTGYDATIEVMTQRHLDRKLKILEIRWVDSLKLWRLNSISERTIDTAGREHLRNRVQLDTVLKISPDDIYRLENAAETLTQPELQRYIAVERDRGSDFIKELEITRDERVAFAFTALILTLIGVGVSSQKRRGGIGIQIGVGLALSFVYLVVLNVSTVVLSDIAPSWVAVWTPNVIFGALAVVVIRAAPK